MHVCGVQAAQQAPAAGFGQPELALQQQLASQGRLPGPLQYPIQAQQLPAGVPTQPVRVSGLSTQRQQGPVNLSSSFPPGYQAAMGRCESDLQGEASTPAKRSSHCIPRAQVLLPLRLADAPSLCLLSVAPPGH